MDKRNSTTSKIGRFRITPLLTGAALLLASACAQAQVEIESKGITITGQRELPKVLYIVPWKKMDNAEIETPKSRALIADVLDPINPEIFKKRLQYFDILSAKKIQPEPTP